MRNVRLFMPKRLFKSSRNEESLIERKHGENDGGELQTRPTVITSASCRAVTVC